MIRLGLVACVLLAVTILSSFFSAMVALMFITATSAADLARLFRNSESEDRRMAFDTFKVRLASSFIGLLLAGFWLVPMASEYEYFVTRPQVAQLGNYLTPVLWSWFGAAILGGFLWRRHPTPAMWPYLSGCATLAGGLIFSSLFSPWWFPLQGPRFLVILIALLSVPIGFAVMAAFRGIAWLLWKLGQAVPSHRSMYPAGAAAAIIILCWLTSAEVKLDYSFYPPEGQPELNGILRFAQNHRNGRYLVEVPPAREFKARFDGRAINAYLSAQGNETLSSVYHEASVNSLFFLPVINAFSGAPYHFGISSVLADDLDFLAQPPHKHLERARLITRTVHPVAPARGLRDHEARSDDHSGHRDPARVGRALRGTQDGLTEGVPGGGWQTANRAPLKERYGLRMAERGYVCVAGEYRVMDEAPWPAQIQDVKATIRWMRANSENLGIDPAAIVGREIGGGEEMARLVHVRGGGARIDALVGRAQELRIPIETVDRRALDKLTRGGVHQGVAADVHPVPTYTLDELVREVSGPPLIVVIDGIEDPQNVGAILRSVVRESWALVAIGVAIGTPAALALTRLLSSLLYGVTTADPWVLSGTALCLFFVALAAALLPAWRASRVDPLVALRNE